MISQLPPCSFTCPPTISPKPHMSLVKQKRPQPHEPCKTHLETYLPLLTAWVWPPSPLTCVIRTASQLVSPIPSLLPQSQLSSRQSKPLTAQILSRHFSIRKPFGDSPSLGQGRGEAGAGEVSGSGSGRRSSPKRNNFTSFLFGALAKADNADKGQNFKSHCSPDILLFCLMQTTGRERTGRHGAVRVAAAAPLCTVGPGGSAWTI